MRMTINDVRAAGHCVKGARRWFADHDMDFREFLTNGIDSEVFLAMGDGIADQIIARRIERDLAALGGESPGG